MELEIPLLLEVVYQKYSYDFRQLFLSQYQTQDYEKNDDVGYLV